MCITDMQINGRTADGSIMDRQIDRQTDGETETDTENGMRINSNCQKDLTGFSPWISLQTKSSSRRILH